MKSAARVMPKLNEALPSISSAESTSTTLEISDLTINLLGFCTEQAAKNGSNKIIILFMSWSSLLLIRSG